VVEFTVDLGELRRALKPLVAAKPRGKDAVGEFVDLSAENNEVVLTTTGAASGFPAAIKSPGYARIPLLVLERWSRTLGKLGEQTALVSVQPGLIRAANLTVRDPGISIRLIGARVADLPIDASFVETLEFLVRFSPEELEDSGLLAKAMNAQAKAQELIEKATKDLAPLELTREDVSALVWGKIKRRIAGASETPQSLPQESLPLQGANIVEDLMGDINQAAGNRQAASLALAELSRWLWRNVVARDALPHSLPEDLEAVLTQLREAMDSQGTRLGRAQDFWNQLLRKFLSAQRLEPAEFYLLRALGLWRVSPQIEYEDFLMMIYEDDKRRTYINPAENPPQPGKLKLRFGIPPESVKVCFLTAEQQAFFRNKLPAVWARFDHSGLR